MTTIGQVCVPQTGRSLTGGRAQAECWSRPRSTRLDVSKATPLNIVPVSRPQGRDAAPGHAQGARRGDQPRCSSRSASTSYSRRSSGGFFGIGRGNPDDQTIPGSPARSTGKAFRRAPAPFNNITGGTTLGLFGKLFGARPPRTLDLAAERRRRHDPRRAEPDGVVGRNRQLPRRRRVPDPDLAGAGRGHDRVQAIWCRPRLHSDRACRRPHLDARPTGSQPAVRCGLRQAQRLQSSRR